MTTVDELERGLRSDPHDLGHPDLGAIRASGRRLRTRRRIQTVGGVVAVAAALAVVASVVTGDAGTRAVEPVRLPPATATPTELSPQAERALAEVPGARQVGQWQVVIPAPHAPRSVDEQVTEDLVTGQEEAPRIPLPAPAYAGVTEFRRSAVPGWLFDATLDVEDGAGSHLPWEPTGVAVDYGRLELTCLTIQPGSDLGGSCAPALLADTGAASYFYLMGPSRLRPADGVHLDGFPDLRGNQPRTFWLGGVDGTAVARLVLTTTDGAEVEAELARGTLSQGDTLFWAPVSGDLKSLSAYDDDGDPIDLGAVRACLLGRCR